MSKKNNDCQDENISIDNIKDEKIVDFKLDTEIESNDETAEVKISKEEELENELADMKDKFLRLQAEFMNYKKRNQKISSDMYQAGKEDAILAILPVADTFDRAIGMCGNEIELEGYQKISKQLNEILANLGVKEIEAEGKLFDYNFQEAVSQIEMEGKESNLVVAVTQKGYTINDKVLRYAKVVTVK